MNKDFRKAHVDLLKTERLVVDIAKHANNSDNEELKHAILQMAEKLQCTHERLESHARDFKGRLIDLQTNKGRVSEEVKSVLVAS